MTKRQLFDEFASVAKAFSHGARLELLEYLFQSERSVEELVELTGQPVANVSQHLQVLRRAHLVEVRRAGLRAYYRSAGPEVFRVWTALRVFGETRVAEIQSMLGRYLHDRETLEAITAKDLLKRLETGDVTVIDVRPREEYEAGHLPGAISVPLDKLSQHVRSLDKAREVVAYCRGPYCVQSDSAVNTLINRGYSARRLEIGLPEWVDQGLPVEKTASSARAPARVSAKKPRRER